MSEAITLMNTGALLVQMGEYAKAEHTFTAATQINNILGTLGVTSRTAAVASAMRFGFVSGDTAADRHHGRDFLRHVA